jgi:hypothetical protein
VGVPLESPIEPLPRLATLVPDEADAAAHDAAAASLASDRAAAQAAADRLAAIEAERATTGEAPTGLAPWAQDIANAALPRDAERRAASEALLERGDLPPALRARVETELADEPLELAGRRLRDARVETYGKVFNAIVTPASRAVSSTFGAIAGVLSSLVGLAVEEHLEDELTRPERQALAHWKRFVEEHPDSPRAPEIVDQIEAAQLRWHRTQRDRALRAARKALDDERWRPAAVWAERALRFAPEDGEATRIHARATREIEREWDLFERSLAAPEGSGGGDPTAAAARDLAVAMLSSDGDLAAAAEAQLAADPAGPFADEARFARATARAEAGAEVESWDELEAVAGLADPPANAARHADWAVENPDQNPYLAFTRARSADRDDRWRWVVLGPLAHGARDRDLPRPIEWIVDLPAIFELVGAFPNRLVRYPFLDPWPFGRAPAVFAQRYLELRPEGAHAGEVRDWLVDYEETRGNFAGALAVAEGAAGEDEPRLAPLREKAARQMLDFAAKEPRRDARVAMYQDLGEKFESTAAGREAGQRVRTEVEQAAPQHIRITRGFLSENPRVAGPEGLGLRPGLLDGELRNGELHPRGVTLLGARVLEFAFVPPSGKDSDEPETVRKVVSDERLARLVALLDETSLRNELVDPDARVAPDADRDLYFERVRLGVASRPDPRPTAESSYVYEGMRERYGLVRARESILPVDLVIQASLPTLSLGAFPRVRMPKATPDAVLYE